MENTLNRITGVRDNLRRRREERNNFDAQGIVNVKNIKDGIIICGDGSHIKILEVLSLNYYQKDITEMNNITDAFGRLFRTCPDILHIKIRTERTDTNRIVKLIRDNCLRSDNKDLVRCACEYIAHIAGLRRDNTLETKYYVVFGYEGDNGQYSRDFNDIKSSMEAVETDIRSKLLGCGNIVLSYSTVSEENFHQAEILYKFYNPLSSENESLQDRINRIFKDYEKKKKKTLKPKEADFIAPRGLTSRPTKDWLLMDGMYHTWLVIKDNAYPGAVQTGWIDLIPGFYGVDVDIYTKRLDRNTVEGALKQIRKYKYSSYNASRTNLDKADVLSKEIQNVEYIKSMMGMHDEDLFNTEIIITIRATTYSVMRKMQKHIQNTLDGMSMYTSTSFLSAHEWLKNVAPDMYYNKSYLSKYGHNMLTCNMAQIYPFTKLSMFSQEGYVIGRAANGSKSLVSINNFDTRLYSNGNMVILGTSGAGKSFLEMMLGYRMRCMGIRTMYILPLKGHEYYNACMKMGGEYIRLAPGSNVCINIMEIRPQVNADGDLLEDAEDMAGMSASLLARKITSLCAFLQLNMQDDKLTVPEKNRFNVLCTKLYANYGITSDNDSIWQNKEKRKLKPMPILQDLNDALKTDPLLSRIKDVLSPYMYGGMFSDFNGETNIDLNNPFLVFDVDKTAIGEDYLPALMYIAFDCCYDLAKQSRINKDAIFLDEVWLLMQNEDCGKQVKEMVKIIRGYGSCSVLATQDIGDFLRAQDGLGESILVSSKIKFFLRMDEMELKRIASVVSLNKNDVAEFRQFPPHGRVMMMADKDKCLIDLIASDTETETFTTDVNLRKAMAKRDKRNKLMK